MILTAIYHMFTTGELFNPCDLYKIDDIFLYEDQLLKKCTKIIFIYNILRTYFYDWL